MRNITKIRSQVLPNHLKEFTKTMKHPKLNSSWNLGKPVFPITISMSSRTPTWPPQEMLAQLTPSLRMEKKNGMSSI